MEQIKKLINNLSLSDLVKLTFHSPCKGSSYKKVIGRPVEIKKTLMIQFEQFTEKQAFHKNVSVDKFADTIVNYLSHDFKKLVIQTQMFNYDVAVSDSGVKITKHKNRETAAPQSFDHNRKKQYLIPENTVVEPLIDLGIFTAEGKIVKSKYDKYKQINRFLEIINDAIKSIEDKKINIVDFGCGKSYLTFVMYYFLKQICNYDVSITGLDLKQDVIDKCNSVAKKYKYENLRFIKGDIKDYVPDGDIDVVICLHACDTATDYALYNAVKWNAKAILAAPCCQHEVNEQIQTDTFSIFTKYGVVKERISALMTDLVRANLLELNDYEVQILEFVEFGHSPKNLLIRAAKKQISKTKKEKAKREIDSLVEEYKINPVLCRLCLPAAQGS